MVNFTPKFIKENKKKIIHETASDYMTTNVITFKANQEIMDVTEKIIQKKISMNSFSVSLTFESNDISSILLIGIKWTWT